MKQSHRRLMAALAGTEKCWSGTALINLERFILQLIWFYHQNFIKHRGEEDVLEEQRHSRVQSLYTTENTIYTVLYTVGTLYI